MKSVLIIDDEIEICESIKMILEYENYHVQFVNNPFDAQEKLLFSDFSLILLDIQMPGMNGFQFLDWLTQKQIQTPVLMISAYSSLENAVQATKLGAFDFLEKPIDRNKLLISVRNGINQNNLLKENIQLKTNSNNEITMIGESFAMKNILEVLNRVAPTDVRVLITGENGTGKELVAKSIFQQSKRNEKPFVEVNCAAIPKELIESELFGHKKGSFTSAISDHVGKFEQANGGTLFLDEIGDMSLEAQSKVLRALEESKIQRVGDTQNIQVDVRVIAATNKNLADEIKNGNFREDLFHRLNVIPIYVPPLRERKDDIPLLINYFNKVLSKKNGIQEKSFHQNAIEVIKNLKLTGNVRQLRNLIERILIMVSEQKVTVDLIQNLLPIEEIEIHNLYDVSNTFAEFKEKTEKIFIEKQLILNNWNISKTAEAMDIQRSHLYNKLKKYGLDKKVDNNG